MGFIDAFVYAHNYHRHNVDNPGKFQELNGGENSRHDSHSRPAHAHAIPSYLPRKTPLSKVSAHRLPRPSTQTFPTSVPELGIKVTTTKDGPCSPMEELIPLMAKLQQAGAPLPAHPMEDCLVQSLPLRPALLYAGARLHINNTAELSSIIEALSFLGLQDPSPAARTHF